jgi:DNA polymerase
VRHVTQATSAAEFLPDRMTLPALARAAECCQGCELYLNATQTVFGSGMRHARVVMIGEAPGDEEDLAGEPFVGPAGKLLRQVMEEVGLAADDVYLTNAVKHFRWEPRGKKRLHKKPNARQIEACKPWLAAELAVVKPNIIVTLGAVASQAILGRGFRLTQQHGKFITGPYPGRVLATYHPSAVLRAPDDANRKKMRRELVADLKLVARRL